MIVKITGEIIGIDGGKFSRRIEHILDTVNICLRKSIGKEDYRAYLNNYGSQLSVELTKEEYDRVSKIMLSDGDKGREGVIRGHIGNGIDGLEL